MPTVKSDADLVTSAEANQLTANMTEILDMIVKDGVHAKRIKLLNATTNLNNAIAKAKAVYDTNQDRTGNTGKVMRHRARVSVKTAHETFGKEINDIKTYLEDIGFTNMEDKLYTRSEIEEKVKPINERSG